MNRVKIGIHGASGRMGKLIRGLIESEFQDRAVLAFTSDSKTEESQLEGKIKTADVVIDFSLPEGLGRLLKIMSRSRFPTPLVSGTTGLRKNQKASLEKAAKKMPILWASNFSTGVLATHAILKAASPLLKKLGYVPVLLEWHHVHKKDAPSGTAISLRKSVSPEHPEKIQTHAIRAGEVIGTHEFTFYGPGDTITIRHFAQDRSIFARGAVESALWLFSKSRGKKPGLFSIEDFFKERTKK